jgi:tetratricopeptide (TPR) repeat protein
LTGASELLLHRTYEPAIEVFEQATLRYPNSPRVLIGLGMALYSRGKYDEAVKALLAAADLNPADPRCYLFLSKAYDSSPNQADDVIQRFRRFAELQPNNALALYYYAMSLWKGKRAEDPGFDLRRSRVVAAKVGSARSGAPEAHVQLGNLYADQHAVRRSPFRSIPASAGIESESSRRPLPPRPGLCSHRAKGSRPGRNLSLSAAARAAHG